jgi:spore germination protein GerM
VNSVRRRASSILLGLVALAAAGCAIPTQGNPSTMPSSKVPFHLLDPHLPTTTTTVPKPTSLVPVKVFFVNPSANNALTSSPRVVPAPAPLTAIITSLLSGPTQADTANGLTTAIPGNVQVLSTVAQGNIVTVNMNAAFGAITGTSIELSVSQIVATVSSENGFNTGVLFEIDGQRVSVPIANGSQVNDPVYIVEFLNVAP